MAKNKGKFRYEVEINYLLTQDESDKRRLEFVANNDQHAKQEAIRMCNAYKKLIDFKILKRVKQDRYNLPYDNPKPKKTQRERYTLGRSFGFTQPSTHKLKPVFSFHYGEVE